MSRQTLALTAVFGMLALGVLAWPLQTYAQEEPMGEQTEAADAIAMALDFVISSPTFAFDGIDETLAVKSVLAMESHPVQYRISVTFDSSQGGYGNRDGQLLTQVITSHIMEITVSDGMVRSAITDGVWDEMTEQFVAVSHNPDEVIGFPQIDIPTKIGYDHDVFFESENLHVVLEDIQDSRCPANVVCVHQGDVKVTLHIIHNEKSLGGYTITKDADDGRSQPVSVAGYVIRALGVEPYPMSEDPIRSTEYVVTLLVSKLTALPPKQQVDAGVPLNDVMCAEGLTLIQKITKDTVACVTPGSAQKLVERGWAA